MVKSEISEYFANNDTFLKIDVKKTSNVIFKKVKLFAKSTNKCDFISGVNINICK